jgi:hypothetical protein
MAPITVANALPPMPVAIYVPPHDKSKARKFFVSAARFEQLVRQAS